MKMINPSGEAVYYNVVTKRGKVQFVVAAADDKTVVLGRDRQRHRSRTFHQEHQAEAWLSRNGFKVV